MPCFTDFGSRFHRDRKKIGLLLAALFALAPCGRTAVMQSADTLLCADTLALFTIADWSKARTVFAHSSAGQLWNDPVLKPFKEKFLQKLATGAIAPLESEFGLSITNLLALAEGPATLVISQDGWDGHSARQPAVLFLIDCKEKSGQLKTNLTELKKKWLNSGRPIKATKIREVEFTTLTVSPSAATHPVETATSRINPGPAAVNSTNSQFARKREWLLGQADSLLVFGNSAKDIEQAMARLTGGIASTNLATQANFASNQATLYRGSLAFGWVNVKRIVEAQARLLAGAVAAADPMMPKPEKLLEASGMSGLQSLSCNWRETGNGSAMEFFLSVPEPTRKGIFKILAAEPKESNPPPFVPADAVRFTRWRLDFPKAWRNLETMLMEISPQAATDKDPDFDLEKSLISKLGDDLIFFERKPRGDTNVERKASSSVFLAGARNADQLAASLRAISAILPADPGAAKERESHGRKIYSLTLPEVSLKEGVKPSTSRLSFAVSSNYVAFSSAPAVLEEFMRTVESKTNSLSDKPGFAKAAQGVGGLGTGLFGYANLHESARTDWEELRTHPEALPELSGVFAVTQRLGFGEEIIKLQRWFDFSLLPAYGQVSKYFYFIVYSGSVTSNGFSFRVFAPVSPALTR